MEPAPNKRVVWHAAHRCFVLGRVHLKGITHTLRALCYPRYRESAASHGPLEPSRLAADARTRVRQLVGPGGRELGAFVDREVTDCVRCLWRCGVGLGEFLNPRLPVPRLTPLRAASRARFEHLRHNAHLYTRRFLAQLHARGWVPVASQVPVGSLDARLGTAVDVVCARAANVRRLPGGTGGFELLPGAPVVLVELKCGFERHYRRYCGPLAPPLEAYTDAPLWQHQLQLLLTRILFERTFRGRGHRVEAAWVARVHADGVSWYPQHPWSTAEQCALWRRLVDQRACVSRRRRSRSRRGAE